MKFFFKISRISIILSRMSLLLPQLPRVEFVSKLSGFPIGLRGKEREQEKKAKAATMLFLAVVCFLLFARCGLLVPDSPQS